MARTLMQQGVGQLEEMFAKGKSDLKVLKQLENELQYRQVPRAVALLAEVQAAMYGGAAAQQLPAVQAPPPGRSTEPAPVSQQPALWGSPEALPVVAPRAIWPPEPPPVIKALPASAPAMPLEEAHKILKATPGATWESIEQMRRTLAQQSHPSRWKNLTANERAQTLTEAERVNAAYAALSQARCGRR